METFQIEVNYTPLTPAECEILKRNIAEVYQTFQWGTYGPNQNPGDFQTKLLTDLETSHLENILITQPQIPNDYAAAILHILKMRYNAKEN